MDSLFLLESREQGPLETISIESIESGSTVLVLESAIAMKVGKLKPTGYGNVANFFRNEHGRTTPAHNAWLLMEALIAGRLDEAKQEFPDAERLAKLIVSDMEKNHKGTVNTIVKRIQRPDWTIQHALQDQVDAVKIFNTLFNKK